jgi:hypothetical protein
MAYQVSPGVNVTEVDLTTVVPGVATATGALAGVFGWGPVGERILISNENQLVSTFGKPNANNAETFFTAANFLSYGNALQLVRAANTTNTAASLATFTLSGATALGYNNTDVITVRPAAGTGGANAVITMSTNSTGGNVTFTIANFGSGFLSDTIPTANIFVTNSTFGNATVSGAAGNTTVSNFIATKAVTLIGAMNAIANTGAVTNIINEVVKNRNDYLLKDGTFDADVEYIAKYPGALGNSLKVSVCDSVNAYSSDVNLLTTLEPTPSTFVAINGSLTINVGSNTATLDFFSNAAVGLANTYATTVAGSFSVNDLIAVGNSTIGLQYLKVTSVSTANVVDSSFSRFTVGFDSSYRLGTNYVVSNTVNGNTTVANVTRNWEYFNTVDSAPTTSFYVANFGNTAAIDTMHVVVVDADGQFGGAPGTVLEVYRDVSRATDAKTQEGASNYYKTVINDGSAYIWWASDRAGASSAAAANVASSSNISPLNLNFVGGTDGYSETSAPLSILASAYDLFKSVEEVDISLVMQGKPDGGSTTVNGQTVQNFQLANYLIQNIAEIRKDCVVFISPDDAIVRANPGAEATSIVNWFGAVADSTYAVYDSGYKYMYDRYNDVYRYVPLNGDIAGLAARTESTNDAWWSPAGFNRGQIKNIVKLRYNPSKADRDVLYKNSVNPIVTFPGQGTVLFGDKTGTKKPSAFGHINVRRLFITVEKAISQSARFSLFEFNDEFTRSQFKNLVIPYLRDVQARRGIQDFLVVCDETNNTPDRIDRGEFWGDIYIKPNRSINFIQLNFVAVRTGVQFSTVIGQF